MSPARALPLLIALLLGVGAAVVAAGCGSGPKRGIPTASADQLNQDLDTISSAVDDGRCDAARAAVVRLRGEIVNLPASTSQRLVQRLRDGADNLDARITSDCQTKTSTTPTTTTPTTSTPTTTTPTTSTPTTTTPTTTTPTTTTPTTTTPTTTTPTTTTPTTTTPTTPGGGTGGTGGTSPGTG